jgi:hypothetical protein
MFNLIYTYGIIHTLKHVELASMIALQCSFKNTIDLWYRLV